MATITGRCDVCKRVFPGEQLKRSHDREDLCPRCTLTSEMVDLQEELGERRRRADEAASALREVEALIMGKCDLLAALGPEPLTWEVKGEAPEATVTGEDLEPQLANPCLTESDT